MMHWLLADFLGNETVSVLEALRVGLAALGALVSAWFFALAYRERVATAQKSTRIVAVVSMRNMVAVAVAQVCVLVQAWNVMATANAQQQGRATLLNGATAFLTSLVLLVAIVWGRIDRGRTIRARLAEDGERGG